jgi:hypothetical protein
MAGETPSIVKRLVDAIADSEHDHPGDDSYIVDLTRRDAIDAVRRITELRKDFEDAIHETGRLREGITKALGMEWTGGVCPDDHVIIAEVARRLGNNP